MRTKSYTSPYITSLLHNPVEAAKLSFMTAREKGELVLIALAISGSATLYTRLPAKLNSGDIVLYASILLLAQGLVRDLWIKFASPKPAAKPDLPHATGPICMCVESTVGVLGVIIGLMLVFAGTQTPVKLAAWFWPVMVGGVLIVGYLIKDFVLDWRGKRIRREKDHQNIVFW